MPDEDDNPFDDERTYVADDATKGTGPDTARPQPKLKRRPARSLDLEPDEAVPTGPSVVDDDPRPAPMLPWVLFGLVTLLFLITTVLLSLRLSSERDRAAFEFKARAAETEKVLRASNQLAEVTARADKAEADLAATKLELEALKAKPVAETPKVLTPVPVKPVAAAAPAKKPVPVKKPVAKKVLKKPVKKKK